jgi:hypothetical protein
VYWRTGITLTIVAFALFMLSGCSEQVRLAESSSVVCGPAWFAYAESVISTGDGQGHGPDPGSEEWRSTIEFKLGIRGRAEIPARMTDEWCQYIDTKIKAANTQRVTLRIT